MNFQQLIFIPMNKTGLQVVVRISKSRPLFESKLRWRWREARIITRAKKTWKGNSLRIPDLCRMRTSRFSSRIFFIKSKMIWFLIGLFVENGILMTVISIESFGKWGLPILKLAVKNCSVCWNAIFISIICFLCNILELKLIAIDWNCNKIVSTCECAPSYSGGTDEYWRVIRCCDEPVQGSMWSELEWDRNYFQAVMPRIIHQLQSNYVHHSYKE